MDSTKCRPEASNVFDELRRANKLCDVDIEVNLTTFRAHKAILYASSPYFCKLFNNRDQQSYRITGLSADTMGLVIQYIYTCSVPISEDNVEDLLHAANKFSIIGLTYACCLFLEANLSPQNCIATWRIADLYFMSELRYHAHRYILHHFEEVISTTRDILKLTYSELRDIIEEDELNVRQENIVFQSIVCWIAHMPSERERYIALLLPKKSSFRPLLEVEEGYIAVLATGATTRPPKNLITCFEVRMGLMNADYFMEHVKNNPFVRGSAICKAIIIEGMQALFEFNMSSPYPDYRNILSRPRLPFSIMLALGGWSGTVPTNAMESFDLQAGNWVNVTQETESPRAYHGAVHLNGFVYCLGGYNSMEYFSSVRRFNPETFTWQEVAPMHTRRCYVSVAVLDGCVYAMGGLDGHLRLNTAERYQPRTNQWNMISAMHEQRSDASATTLRGKVYICGGFNGQECLITAEIYSPVFNQWTEITPMINRRSGLGTIAYCEEVFVVGGFDGISRLRSADAYDPLTHSWRILPAMITARSNFGVEVLDNQLFVMGGFNGTTTTDYAECYDKMTDEWSVVHCMSFFRSALSCCVISNPPNLLRFTVPRPSRDHEEELEAFRLPYYPPPSPTSSFSRR